MNDVGRRWFAGEMVADRQVGNSDEMIQLIRSLSLSTNFQMDDASKQNSGGGGGGAEAAAAATEGAGKSQGQQQTKQTELAFKLYDKDKDGYITKTEMEKLSKNLTKEQIEKVFARFDADGDGRLSYAEFRKMMMK